MPKKSASAMWSRSAMPTVKAFVSRIFFVVLCSSSMKSATLSIALICPQAAFITLVFPLLSYAATINTGIGNSAG